MLKLRDPIQLHMNQDITTGGHGLEHRIGANYQVIGARLIAQDLIHLTNAPMELFFQEGSVTSLVADNHVTTNQEVKLELVNNVVNRIAMIDQGRLTYQDQVFITNVLQKIGVTDVAQFMTYVRQNKGEKLQTQQLLEQYRQTVHLQDSSREILETATRLEHTTQAALDRQATAQWHIHQDIYRRLDTIANYHHVAQYATAMEGNSYDISKKQMLLAETTAVENALLLAEYRSYMAAETVAPITKGYNPYELVQETVEPTVESVKNQMSTAILFQMVENLLNSRLQNFVENSPVWYRIYSAMNTACQTTVQRFAQYHQEGRTLQATYESQETANQQLLKQETNLLENIQNYSQYTAKQSQYLEENSQLWEGNQLSLSYLSQSQTEVEGDEYAIDSQGETVAEPLEQSKKPVPTSHLETSNFWEIRQEDVAYSKSLVSHFRQALMTQERQEITENLTSHLRNLHQMVFALHNLRQADLYQTVLLTSQFTSQAQWEQYQEWESVQQTNVNHLAQQWQEESTRVFHQETTTQEGDQTQETTETSNFDLQQYLTQVNGANLERKAQIEQRAQMLAGQLPGVKTPDLARTRDLARLAIESPEKVKEYLEKQEIVQNTDRQSQRIELLLASLDPVTRTLLEQAVHQNTQFGDQITQTTQNQEQMIVQLMGDIVQAETTVASGLDSQTTVTESQTTLSHHRDTSKTLETLEQTTTEPQSTVTQVLHQYHGDMTKTETIQSALETIYRQMETIMPTQSVSNTVQRERMEHTNYHSTQEMERILASLDPEIRTLLEQAVHQNTQFGNQITQTTQNQEQLVVQLIRDIVQGKTTVESVLDRQTSLMETQTTLTHHRDTTQSVEHRESDVAETQSTLLQALTQYHRDMTQMETTQSVLETIYRQMETVMPAQLVSAAVQRELMEYTNFHSTQEIFSQTEQVSQQVYHQATHLLETVEQEQKQRIIQRISENIRETQTKTTEIQSQVETVHRQSESQVTETISEAVAQILYNTVAYIPAQHTEELVRQSVPLVLKQMEAEIPPEIAQLLQESQTVKPVAHDIQVVKETTTVTQTTDSKAVLEAQVAAHDEAERVRKLVEKSIQNQVGAITEKVYGKLEKRLQMERARRGR